MSLMRKPVRQANREAAFNTGMSQGVAASCFTSSSVFFHILWFNLVKIVIDILPKPFVPISNLQQTSKRRVVAGCRIEGDRVVAMFELLGVQQIFTELLAQVHIHLTEGTLPFDEVVEMLKTNAHFWSLLRHIFLK